MQQSCCPSTKARWKWDVVAATETDNVDQEIAFAARQAPNRAGADAGRAGRRAGNLAHPRPRLRGARLRGPSRVLFSSNVRLRRSTQYVLLHHGSAGRPTRVAEDVEQLDSPEV